MKRPRWFTADGAQKLTRFANCGTTATAVEKKLKYTPPFAEYFNPKLAVAYDHLEQTAMQRPSPEEADTECQADLLAARSTPSSSKCTMMDVKLVVGCVCPHTVGLR